MIIKRSTHPHDFNKFIKENIGKNDYRYKYLNLLLEKKVSKNSFILQDKDSWVIFIEDKSIIGIYSHNHSASHVKDMISHIDLNKYNDMEIMGSYDLIYDMLNASSIKNYTVLKDRCFYQLNTPITATPHANMEEATINDIGVLIPMFQAYYSEEYNGENEKSPREMRERIEPHIDKKSLYIIRENSIIKAFCTINDSDIGILFTKSEYRNEGLGQCLLKHCSKILLDKINYSSVMTDMHNPISNKVCTKIGYNLIYRHTNILLNKKS